MHLSQPIRSSDIYAETIRHIEQRIHAIEGLINEADRTRP